ncbi:hypothetical protein D5F01_LYC07852 [Larimichthys crocea]|uniref:SAM domain-containing protein n=1 Tax=Larimichthys crocea TaxID=215358 RepID=A0A6G0IMV8_LARCR|nr:hypothetical protein D5F01_LYC07852 [Larimichthys crocea]
MMDEFVKEKLNEWSLTEWIPTFEAQQIDRECFFLLDGNSLTSLIPVLGPRLKFHRQLKKLLEDSSPTPAPSLLLDPIPAPEGTPWPELPAEQHISVEQGARFDAWFTPGRAHKPATGYLEERLRNVRKRNRKGSRVNSAPVMQATPILLPEPIITAEKCLQLTLWLKNNIWPQATVSQYMLETAVHRANWIRQNGTKTIQNIMAEFPRLMDTPGMIAQDFEVIHPECTDRMSTKWIPELAEKIIRMARKENTGGLLSNISSLSADQQGDIALQLLPVLLPTVTYKIGRKVYRPSKLEVRRAFIDIQPPGTNMVQYLATVSSSIEYPYVLMLGEEHQCSQAFVIIGGIALEHPSLLGAVDGCFKAFFVFDINYPKPCAQVWEFIQTGIFELPGHESNAVKLIRSQLAAMESSNTPS